MISQKLLPLNTKDNFSLNMDNSTSINWEYVTVLDKKCKSQMMREWDQTLCELLCLGLCLDSRYFVTFCDGILIDRYKYNKH